ncbi:MAG: hypothetical protein WCW02_01505 [Candidatus Buchananbacteria bacterium]
MMLEEEFNKDIWSLLQEIKSKILRASQGSDVEFLKPATERLSLFSKLKEWGVTDDDWVFAKDYVGLEKLILTVHQPEFDQLYDKFKYEFSPKIQILEREIIRERPEQEKITKNKFPYRLPSGTIWANVTIKFLDDENIFIQVGRFKHSTNYKEMGFVGKGNNPNPSEGWVFLRVLARVHGELTLKDPEARDKYKKQKELLTKSLQDYFSIDYDPFFPYRSSTEKHGNSYQIKITLIPSLSDQNEKGPVDDDNDGLGVKEYLDSQTKQVYEEE